MGWLLPPAPPSQNAMGLKRKRFPTRMLTIAGLVFVMAGVIFGMCSGLGSLASAADPECRPVCLDCHFDETKGEHQHQAVKTGCQQCHEVAHDSKTMTFPEGTPSKGLVAEKSALCFRCHDPLPFKWANSHPDVLDQCLTCHDPHSSNSPKVLKEAEPGLCYTCHDKKVCSGYTQSEGHLEKGLVCSTCHDPHSSPRKKLLRGEDPGICYECHSESGMFEGKSFHSAIGLGCSFCHDAHSTEEEGILKAQPAELCYKCHKPFNKSVIHPPIEMCTSCHDPHASENDKLLLIEVSKLCTDCHKSGKFKGRYIHGPVALGLCVSCHFPHDSDNEKLLRAPGADLCFMCHYDSDFKRKNVHPPVAKGECLKCHDAHAAPGRFQIEGPINDLCLVCHERQAVGTHVLRGMAGKSHPMKGVPDPRRPGRRFACSGCHNPHSSDSMRLFRYPGERAFDICVNCHEK